MITGIKLTVRGEVEGLDAAGFEKAAQGGEGRLPGRARRSPASTSPWTPPWS